MAAVFLWIFAVSCLFTFVGTRRVGWETATGFPDPRTNFTACGRDKPSWVCDPSNTMPDFLVDALDEVIDSFTGIDRCLCDEEYYELCPATFRHRVMIAIVHRFTSYSGDEKKDYQFITRFAKTLQDVTWKHHQSVCSLFIVMVYDLHQKDVGMSMERHTSRFLPHYNVNDMKLFIKVGEVFEGTKATLDDIKKRLVENTNTSLSTSEIVGIVLGIVALSAVLCLGLVFVCRRTDEDKADLLDHDVMSAEHETNIDS